MLSRSDGFDNTDSCSRYKHEKKTKIAFVLVLYGIYTYILFLFDTWADDMTI